MPNSKTAVTLSPPADEYEGPFGPLNLLALAGVLATPEVVDCSGCGARVRSGERLLLLPVPGSLGDWVPVCGASCAERAAAPPPESEEGGKR